MLLIRPLLQTNRERTRVKHTVVFFIFLVSNVGGMLTPLGDPPLFLGYLARRAVHVDLPAVAALGLDASPCCSPRYFVWDSRAVRARAAGGPPARPRRASSRCACGAALNAVLARRRRARRGVPARALARGWPSSRWPPCRSGCTPARDPPGQRLLGRADRRGRRAVRRDLRHDDPGARPAAAARRRAGRARAVAVLLGDGRALVVPRQRADLSDLPGARRRGCGLARRGRGRARTTILAAISVGRRLHGRQHLHRQRARTSWSRRSPRRRA